MTLPIGLYFGYGIGGKVTSKYSEGEETEEESFDFFGKQDIGEGETKREVTNRFDTGLTLGLTLQYSKFTLGLGYDYGLLTVDKKIEDEYSLSEKGVKNGNFKVSVGYFF
ncbi:hypothetical protein EZS27_007109 [termite gut metagenome]|uniref:Outer membrane protein beta-barrel domain-containing protein n=1 Tax=termite gut metagenome TaxID=433724 RepID=A0A5J4SGN1_9ZZZZ